MVSLQKLVLGYVGLCLAFAFGGCSDPGDPGSGTTLPEADFSALSISQGIAGHVWFWEGAFEPGAVRGTVSPVVRWILVYPHVPPEDRTDTLPGGFFSAIRSFPVDSVESDSTGFFQIDLPEGSYSLFLREGDLWYMKGSNDVQVHADSVLRFHIDVDYLAGF